MVEAIVDAKRFADAGSPVIDQLALARLIASHDYDRHLRAARRRHIARRDALLAALHQHLPGTKISGTAAGLYLVIRPLVPVDERDLMRAAAQHDVGVDPLAWCHAQPQATGGALILGYACMPQAALNEGVRRLALAISECSPTTSSG